MPGADLRFPEDWPSLLLLVAVGAIASGINAVAGGGTLLSFPVLVGLRLPALEANATNAAALWPGSLGGAAGFWNLLPRCGGYLKWLVLPSLLGSSVGALLLVLLGERVFDIVVPFLILAASAVLAAQHRIKSWVETRHGGLSLRWGMALQFLVSVYGGYFGAGMGIMMLAAFALFIDGTIHELNAMKAWLGLLINFTAALVFVLQGRVIWAPCAALAAGAIAGGFLAARQSQRLDSEKLRWAIAVYGFATAVYFGWRALSL